MLKSTIRPEFLNRIDELIMFKPLGRDEIRGIVDIQFESLRKMLAEQGIVIKASQAALDWLGEIGYDPSFGARPLKRAIQREVLNILSREILSGTVSSSDTIELDIDTNKKFVFKNS